MLPEGPPVGEGAAPLHLRRSLVRLRRTRLRRESAIASSTSTANLPLTRLSGALHSGQSGLARSEFFRHCRQKLF